MKKLLILLTILSFAACSDDDKRTGPCTTEFISGLRITVKDNGFSILDGITVTAQDGEYTETLTPLELSSNFEGAGERPGTYILTVSGEGYNTYTSEPITVTEDECHVITQEITINVEPID